MNLFLGYPVPVACYAAGVLLATLFLIPRLSKSILPSQFAYWVVGALYLVAFFLIPSQNHLMGDGLTHLGATDRVLSATEPLDILLHHFLYRLIGSTLWSYRIISLIGGAFYLWGVFLISKLGKDKLESAIIALSFLCLGTIQFYFGYVESYTLVNVFALYYIYFSWRDLKRKRNTWMPVLFFILALVSHFSAISLLPSLIYLKRRNLQGAMALLIALVLLAGAVVAWKVNIFQIFVLPWTTTYSTYTLFCWQHLTDILQIILLVTPSFFLAFWKAPRTTTLVFAVLALAGAFIFSFTVDPKIGAVRDWDLLSCYALPLGALVALRAPRRTITVAILVLLLVARVLPWILFNSQNQLAFLKNVVENDVHYSDKFDNGQRLVSWGVLLMNESDSTGAEKVWQERLNYDPNHDKTLVMLAPLEFKLKKYKDAYDLFSRLIVLQPENLEYKYKAIYSAFKAGQTQIALETYQETPVVFKQQQASARLLAGILGDIGRHKEAVSLMEQTADDDAEGYLSFVLAKSCIAMGKTEQALNLAQGGATRSSECRLSGSR